MSLSIRLSMLFKNINSFWGLPGLLFPVTYIFGWYTVIIPLYTLCSGYINIVIINWALGTDQEYEHKYIYMYVLMYHLLFRFNQVFFILLLIFCSKSALYFYISYNLVYNIKNNSALEQIVSSKPARRLLKLIPTD